MHQFVLILAGEALHEAGQFFDGLFVRDHPLQLFIFELIIVDQLLLEVGQFVGHFVNYDLKLCELLILDLLMLKAVLRLVIIREALVNRLERIALVLTIVLRGFRI